MLSTTPLGATTILAPPPGGRLICLWLPSDAAILVVCRTLRRLIILPTCGAQSWTNTHRVLFVAWAEAEQVTVVRGLLSAFGTVVDWPSSLVLSGDWVTFGGQPLFADREYELLAREACA